MPWSEDDDDDGDGDDKHESQNYRLISLLSRLCKVLGRLKSESVEVKDCESVSRLKRKFKSNNHLMEYD